jgi:hypothetical protein
MYSLCVRVVHTTCMVMNLIQINTVTACCMQILSCSCPYKITQPEDGREYNVSAIPVYEKSGKSDRRKKSAKYCIFFLFSAFCCNSAATWQMWNICLSSPEIYHREVDQNGRKRKCSFFTSGWWEGAPPPPPPRR